MHSNLVDIASQLDQQKSKGNVILPLYFCSNFIWISFVATPLETISGDNWNCALVPCQLHWCCSVELDNKIVRWQSVTQVRSEMILFFLSVGLVLITEGDMNT